MSSDHGRLARWRKWRACDVGEAKEGLDNELWHRWRAHSPTSFVTLPMSQLILQLFRRFTYVTALSPNLSLFHLCHSSFSNPSVASPISQLILQPFRCFTYVTAHSPNLPLLHLRHSSFSNSSVALPTSQVILQIFRCFTYVTAHFPTLPLPHLCHSPFSKPSFASPASQALHLRHLASRQCFWWWRALKLDTHINLGLLLFLNIGELVQPDPIRKFTQYYGRCCEKQIQKVSWKYNSVRPGAHQSSKADFSKSAFAKTCSNVLPFVKDMTGAHQSSKKQKYFRARFGMCNEQNAFS